jgi:hypothetical protein
MPTVPSSSASALRPLARTCSRVVVVIFTVGLAYFAARLNGRLPLSSVATRPGCGLDGDRGLKPAATLGGRSEKGISKGEFRMSTSVIEHKSGTRRQSRPHRAGGGASGGIGVSFQFLFFSFYFLFSKRRKRDVSRQTQSAVVPAHSKEQERISKSEWRKRKGEFRRTNSEGRSGSGIRGSAE